MPKITEQTQTLIWIDIETTGTSFQSDVVLEVAAIATNLDLVIQDEFQVYIYDSNAQTLAKSGDGYVYNMHENSGLFDYCTDNGVELISAQVAFHNWLRRQIGPLTLAGSGVSHFDKNFLKRDALIPGPGDWTYYDFDIGHVRRAFQLAGKEEAPASIQTKAHRAMEDARQHLEEARQYIGQLITLDQ